MKQSFTFVFHAFISPNKIHSSNHLCRKSYRLADVYLENISLLMLIVNDSRRNGYVQAVDVAVFRCRWLQLSKACAPGKKTGLLQAKNTDYVMRTRVRRFQYFVRRLLFGCSITSGRLCRTSAGTATDPQSFFRIIQARG
ncbi:MAG: hypothetical protein WCH04_11650 [Gammaproteobacteria bacterium]